MPRAAISQAASWLRMSPSTPPGHAHVAVDHAEQRGVGLAAFVEFQRRDAQTLGVDLGAVRRIGAGHAPADIGVVADRRRVGDRPAAMFLGANSGLKMKMSGRCMPPSYGSLLIRMSPSAMSSPKCRSTAWSATGMRAEMPRQGETLCGQPSLRIAQRGAVIHDVLQHPGIGGAVDRQHHLVAECGERIAEQFFGDRVWRVHRLIGPPKSCGDNRSAKAALRLGLSRYENWAELISFRA